MNLSVQDVWPQYSGNYCGIEAAIAVVNYDNLNSGYARSFTSRSYQDVLATRNGNAWWSSDMLGGQSQWTDAQGRHYATPTNYWGGKTNIAPDYGTDPRSVAWLTWYNSLNNRFFHDHIYSKDQDQGTLTRQDQVNHATTLMGRALADWSEPVIAFINGGLHAVVVTGLWSGNNIYNNYPAQIQGLVYRDPDGGNREELDYSYWRDGHYTGANGFSYSLWAEFYGDLPYQPGHGGNTNDPEPTIGPYVPGVRYPTHWWKNLNWVQRDNNWDGTKWNPDFAYTAVGNMVL